MYGEQQNGTQEKLTDERRLDKEKRGQLLREGKTNEEKKMRTLQLSQEKEVRGE